MQGYNTRTSQEAGTRIVRNSTADIMVITVVMAVAVVLYPAWQSCDRNKSGMTGSKKNSKARKYRRMLHLRASALWKRREGDSRRLVFANAGHCTTWNSSRFQEKV